MNKVIVRLSTCYWNDNKGIYQRRDIRFLKRKSIGFNFLKEDADQADAESCIKSIINLNKCKDGIYEAKMINISTDRESGYLDGWDVELVPFLG